MNKIKNIKKYFDYFKQFYLVSKKFKIYIFLILLLLFLNSIFETIGIGLLMPMIDLISGIKSDNIVIRYIVKFFEFANIPMKLRNILMVFFLLIVLKNIFKLFEAYLYSNFRRKLMFVISYKIFDNLMKVGYSYFHSTQKGNILYTITGTSGQMGHIIISGNKFLMSLFLLLGYFILLLILSYKLTIFSIILSLFLYPFIKKLLNLTHNISKKLTETQQIFNSFFVEIIDGIQIVKVFNREKYVIEKFCKKWDDYLKSSRNSFVNSSLINAISSIATVLIVIVIIAIAIKLFNFDFSGLVIYLFVLYKFIPTIHNLISELNEILSALPPVKIAIKAMSKEDKPYLIDGEIKIKEFNKNIIFQNVYFSYLKDVPVLKNINIEFEKGKNTAIIGATGSGKSTIVSLLLRFYDVNKGKIIIDDVDLKEIKIGSWLNLISYVPQDVFLFNVSIKENILFGRLDASDDEVIEAAKLANAHNFIMRLPNKYDTIIGERGVKLSGGQKQMIALARALVKKPQILILDEATSSLDNESEKLIQDSINKISKHITIIAIAHRLSTIINSDKIIVLDKGEIKEIGRHFDLLKLNGYYSKYYNLHLRSMEN
ncbi:MAG TPA: ABC transporter ATP-binding protein [bacterium]|nr:ABC transporter ATP-binding protein [bacterium]